MNSCVTAKVHVLERHGINDNLKIFETYPKLSLGRLGTSVVIPVGLPPLNGIGGEREKVGHVG